MLGLGTSAPAFDLPDTVSGRSVSLDSFAGKKGLLVMFLCAHCPYVKHIHSGLGALAKDYAASDLGMVAISSNDAGSYPDDGPDGLRRMARKLGFQFPFCYDETQETAKAYQAACTPDFFLFDAARRLVYRGQFDASRPGNTLPVTGADLRAAADAVLAGRAIEREVAGVGCSIKWKAGH